MSGFDYLDQPGYGPAAPVVIIQEEIPFGHLLELYRERAPKRVLEIGTYAGGTLFHWLQNATRGTLVVSADLYEDKDNSEQYPDWCAPGVDFHVVRGHSGDLRVIEEVRSLGSYEWAFIDAGHRYGEVLCDWLFYAPMVVGGGVIAMHDVLIEMEAFPRIQVWKLWKGLQALYDTEVMPGGGAGIGVVHVPAKGIETQWKL